MYLQAGVGRRRSAEQVPDVLALSGVYSRRLKRRAFTQFLVVGWNTLAHFSWLSPTHVVSRPVQRNRSAELAQMGSNFR
jgi:hypothetical protein